LLVTKDNSNWQNCKYSN